MAQVSQIHYFLPVREEEVQPIRFMDSDGKPIVVNGQERINLKVSDLVQLMSELFEGKRSTKTQEIHLYELTPDGSDYREEGYRCSAKRPLENGNEEKGKVVNVQKITVMAEVAFIPYNGETTDPTLVGQQIKLWANDKATSTAAASIIINKMSSKFRDNHLPNYRLRQEERTEESDRPEATNEVTRARSFFFTKCLICLTPILVVGLLTGFGICRYSKSSGCAVPA